MGPKRGIFIVKIFSSKKSKNHPEKKGKKQKNSHFAKIKKNTKKKTLMFPPLCPVPGHAKNAFKNLTQKKVESYEQGERFYDYQQIN